MSTPGLPLTLADRLALVLLVLDDEHGRHERAAVRLHAPATGEAAAVLVAAPALASALARGCCGAELPPPVRALRRWLELHDLRPAARDWSARGERRRAARWNR